MFAGSRQRYSALAPSTLPVPRAARRAKQAASNDSAASVVSGATAGYGPRRAGERPQRGQAQSPAWKRCPHGRHIFTASR